jgi:hypothetical protein
MQRTKSKRTAGRAEADHYIPSRPKQRIRPRGWIRFEDLPQNRQAQAVIADILARLRQHEREDTLPRGPNGLFYDLCPHGMPDNPRGVTYTKHPTKKGRDCMQATGVYVGEKLALLRRVFNPETGDWLVNEKWISDSRAPDPLVPNEITDAEMEAWAIAASIRRLWLARQAGQSVYLELRCESADLMPRIAHVAKPYGVPVYSGSGMDGLKPKKEAAERAARRSVPTKIGHLADYNIAGGNIADAFAEDTKAFCKWHHEYECYDGSVSIERLALTLTQAREHELLAPDGTAEVDGLPVPVLDAIVRNFIESNLDMNIQRKVIEAEPKMRIEVARHLQRIMKKPR